MGNLLQITPFMQVAEDNFDRAVRFFTEILGFSAPVLQDGYAYLEREGCGIRIMEQEDTRPAPPGNRRFAYYLDVRDVDALFAELKPKLEPLPPGDVLGPVDQRYGQRELIILAPDGNLLVFGQSRRQGPST